MYTVTNTLLLWWLQVIQHSDQVFRPSNGGVPNSANEDAPDQRRLDDSVSLSRHAGSLSPTTKGKVGELEAMLSVDLSHPNIVQTYKTATRPLQVGPTPFLHTTIFRK